MPALSLLTPQVCLTLFVLDLAAALFMTGVIWTVQIVHYPLFARVGEAGWATYHQAHTRQMTYVVLPAMVAELGTSALLALAHPPGLSRGLLWLGLGLAAMTWATTFFLSVPLHGALSRGFAPSVLQRLVGTNWLRTAFWTGHALVLLLQLWRFLPQLPAR